MINLSRLIYRAKTSGFYLRILNIGLNRMVPFNKPHGFKVLEIGDFHLKTLAPYKRRNFNHIKGIHACALATLAEFTTGLLLLIKLDPKNYRLIMQKLTMEYHYQARMDAEAFFSISDEWLRLNILDPLSTDDKVTVNCEVKIHDTDNNHLSTGIITWQIKKWDKVRTKV
jgi:acyl-coenzyme A thioesterase PaaI-like protein